MAIAAFLVSGSIVASESVGQDNEQFSLELLQDGKKKSKATKKEECKGEKKAAAKSDCKGNDVLAKKSCCKDGKAKKSSKEKPEKK